MSNTPSGWDKMDSDGWVETLVKMDLETLEGELDIDDLDNLMS